MKAITEILMQPIAALPFFDKVGGLAITLEKAEPGINGTTMKEIKIPITDQILGAAAKCLKPGQLVELIPDTSLKGLAYFEEQGTTAASITARRQQLITRLRFVAWINPAKFTTAQQEDQIPKILSQVLAAFSNYRSKAAGSIQGLTVKLDKIGFDKGIFSRYSYSEKESQYLMPPYQYFSLDLQCSYFITPGCLEVNVEDPCPAQSI